MQTNVKTRMDPEDLNQLIKKRRSVFISQFTGERVKDDIILQMLENANWAPTHRFTEPWRFKVFVDEGRQRLADFQSEMYKKHTQLNNTFQQKKYEGLKSKPLIASHIIAIGMKRSPENVIPEIEEIASVASAVQNMQLTAASYGLGCYWGTGGVTYIPEAKSFFDLTEQDRLMGFLYVGIPKTMLIDGKRGSILDKVTWER